MILVYFLMVFVVPTLAMDHSELSEYRLKIKPSDAKGPLSISFDIIHRVSVWRNLVNGADTKTSEEVINVPWSSKTMETLFAMIRNPTQKPELLLGSSRDILKNIVVIKELAEATNYLGIDVLECNGEEYVLEEECKKCFFQKFKSACSNSVFYGPFIKRVGDISLEINTMPLTKQRKKTIRELGEQVTIRHTTDLLTLSADGSRSMCINKGEQRSELIIDDLAKKTRIARTSLPIPGNDIRIVAFNKSGSACALVIKDLIRVYSESTNYTVGFEIKDRKQARKEAALALDHEGVWLAYARNHKNKKIPSVGILNIEDGSVCLLRDEIKETVDYYKNFNMLAFNPARRQLAIAAASSFAGEVILFTSKLGKWIKERVLRHGEEPLTCAFNNKGDLLATGNKSILLWDVDSGICTARIKMEFPNRLLAFNHDGSLLGISQGDPVCEVFVVPVKNKGFVDKEMHKVRKSTSGLRSLAFDADNNLLVSTKNFLHRFIHKDGSYLCEGQEENDAPLTMLQAAFLDHVAEQPKPFNIKVYLKEHPYFIPAFSGLFPHNEVEDVQGIMSDPMASMIVMMGDKKKIELPGNLIEKSPVLKNIAHEDTKKIPVLGYDSNVLNDIIILCNGMESAHESTSLSKETKKENISMILDNLKRTPKELTALIFVAQELGISTLVDVIGSDIEKRKHQTHIVREEGCIKIPEEIVPDAQFIEELALKDIRLCLRKTVDDDFYSSKLVQELKEFYISEDNDIEKFPELQKLAEDLGTINSIRKNTEYYSQACMSKATIMSTILARAVALKILKMSEDPAEVSSIIDSIQDVPDALRGHIIGILQDKLNVITTEGQETVMLLIDVLSQRQ
jgi:hypothetical protein